MMQFPSNISWFSTGAQHKFLNSLWLLRLRCEGYTSHVSSKLHACCCIVIWFSVFFPSVFFSSEALLYEPDTRHETRANAIKGSGITKSRSCRYTADPPQYHLAADSIAASAPAASILLPKLPAGHGQQQCVPI